MRWATIRVREKNMRVIEQSTEILDWSGLNLYERVETAARVCRRSESKGDAEGFVRSLIKRGHYPPLEFARIKTWGDESESVRRIREIPYMGFVERLKAHYPALVEDIQCSDRPFSTPIEPANDWIPVLFVTSRTISHQLVRYRHEITFCQESQRHVRYDRDGIEVIEPPGLGMQVTRGFWYDAAVDAEDAYRCMMAEGATAEQARAVLPGCTATRILAYASPDEWRHIFSQRCDEHADPQMSALMIPLRDEMRARGLV